MVDPRDDQRLLQDALTLSVNKNLDDVTTLLQWAHQADTPGEKLKHIEQAMRLLEDVRHSLAELDRTGP